MRSLKVCDSLMVYRSGLLSIISYRSIVQSFTIRYFHYRNYFSGSMLSDRFWTEKVLDRSGLSPFEISKISGEWNAWKRGILKGEQAEGAGRQAGRGLYPVEEQTTTPTHPKISSPEWLKPNTQRHAYRPTPLYFHFQSLSLSSRFLRFLFFDPPPPPLPVSRPRHPSSRVREILPLRR